MNKNYKPKETKKFNDWVRYFTDQGSRETYGNATRSALKAYQYNPKTQYHLASVTGSKNMRKYECLAIGLLDMMGLGFGELLKIGLKKAMDGSYSDWDRFMVRLGYFEPEKMIGANIQINNNQFNFEDIRKEMAESRRLRGLNP